MQEIDVMLYRKLRSGKEFETLIPKSSNTITPTGYGDTSYSISEMQDMVKEYSYQLEKVARILEKSSLLDTVVSVKDFAYWNFQYKADQELQLLRSPAGAWQNRFDGIDCKSYSIIASCLFTEMNIKHYIRKISQPTYEPTEFTHVYVIVPLDQVTGNLDKGYYTVDGTLPTSEEPAFILTKDFYMNLPHARLNRPALHGGTISFATVKALFRIENVTSIKSLLNAIKCIGGSAYTNDGLKKHLESTTLYFNNLVDRINQAVKSDNRNELSNAVAEFYGMSKMFVLASNGSLAKVWNPCTEALIKVQIKAFTFYRDVVGKALDVWLTDNYTEAMLDSGMMQFTSSGLESKYKMRFLNPSKTITLQEQIFALTPKPKNIPNFEFTPYLVDLSATNGTNFNPIEFLQGLNTIANSFEPTPTAVDTNGNVITLPNGSTTQPVVEKQGFGVLGWLIVLGGAGYAFTKMKDKPATTAKK